MKRPLIVLTGPTAVGKTALSLELARAVNGEIISADSMQVYRGMDIGSAKVSPEEMQGIPHHLVDILKPEEPFDVFRFQQLAKQAAEDIWARKKIPIVAGGTGFYIQALIYDIDFTEESDGEIRRELEKLGEVQGARYMHELLREIDPDSADEIHENNRKRVIRAIEFFRLTGKRISEHNRQERERQSPYDSFYYVLNTDRERVYARIDERVDRMIENGLVDEVRRLKSEGCTRDMVSMQGLGYKEILDYLDGAVTLDEAVRIIKRDTRHFAKRQITWFKREKDVRWLNLWEFHDNRQEVLLHILEETRASIEAFLNYR